MSAGGDGGRNVAGIGRFRDDLVFDGCVDSFAVGVRVVAVAKDRLLLTHPSSQRNNWGKLNLDQERDGQRGRAEDG